MAIAYIPSEGNLEKVGLRRDGFWFGESIGGAALPLVRTDEDENRGNYFGEVYSNLDQSSTWFYKDVTDYNFVNGITLYRCVYIGADERFDESEIVGDVAVSISNNGPTDVDNSVQIDLIYDGTYTKNTSKNTTVLYDDQDSTGVLANRTDWASSHTNNSVLLPGNYHKYFIRMRFTQDVSLADFVDFQYFITVKDLTIPVQRTNGRLNFSRVFTMELDDPHLKLKASLPRSFQIENIVKVIEHNGLTNIFYYKDDGSFTNLKLLVILRDEILIDNKYIDIDLSTVIPNIIQDETFYQNFSECCQTSPTSGTPATSGTSGAPTSGDPCVFKPLSDEFDEFLGNRYLIDIFGTQKSDRNDFYIFFNTFLSDTTDEFITKYGHKNYYWNSGVVHVNLNNINVGFFANVESGFSNTKTVTLTQQYEEILLDRFRTTSIILQDDLFSGVGQIPEDCRVENNLTKLWYLYEGEIIRREPNVQLFNIPQVRSNELFTVPNMTNARNDLVFDPELVDTLEFGYNRSLGEFEDGTQFVKMGPPHQKRLHHGFSDVSYDINEDLEEFSTTWAFGIESSSLVVAEQTETVSCSTTGASGTVGTSGTSGTPASGAPLTNDPNEYHVVLQSDFGKLGEADTNLNFVNEMKGIFNLHCNGNTALSAVKVDYNWFSKEWEVHVQNDDGEDVVVEITSGPKLSTSHPNVITLNVYRHQDYGCFKKFIVQYSIHVNGEELINGTTYTTETTDTYAVTHNYENAFSGWVSYWEVRNYMESEAEIYAEAMYRIHSNIAWAELEPEVANPDQSTDLKHFNFRRNLLIKNLDWDQDADIIFPIVLQGTGYGIDDKYNEEVRRSVFDFSRIDVNQKSLAFALEGTSNKLQWIADTFDIDRDILVVWVRLEKWNGQRVTMYYSDSRLFVDEGEFNKPFNDFYAFWKMDEVVRIPSNRFVDQKLFEGGESYIWTKNASGQEVLEFIDRQYQFGYGNFYKSNKFDVAWDDRQFDREETEDVNEFISEAVRQFKPNYMEIRDTKSIYNYRLETENNNEIRGSRGSGNIVIPASQRCRR
jgi:hypothetical protein